MTPQKTMSPQSCGELLFLGVIWGGSFIGNSVALGAVGVFPTVAFRLTGACLVLWAFVLWRGLAVPRGWRIWGAFAVMGLLNNALPFSLITWGQQTVPAGLAAIINSSTAIFGVLIASLAFRDERLGLRRVLGVITGFLGVSVAIGLHNLSALDPASVGQLACLTAAVSYGLSGAWARRHLSHLPPQVAAAGMLTTSAAMTLPLAVWTGLPHGLPPLPVWGALLYLALISTALAYLLLYRLIAAAGAGNASLNTFVAAPTAMILGAVILGESLPARAYPGFALIALGLLLLDGRILRYFSRARPGHSG
ncbi:DMT family transporter [Neotabrizicola sp. VNH66]|uniref:DMT family transporter n=1 Tax=Neotabrizicola sp. VNH66 TaxID=3400918 RepID=UPI003C00FC01